MTASTHDTILLSDSLTGIVPDAGYRVIQSGLTDIYQPAMTTDRSLTGHLHIHRVGGPLVFEGYKYTCILTREEKDNLLTLLGKVVYFMHHYRDETDVDYRQVMLFKSVTDVQNIDPMLEWWLATIELEEATGQSV